MILLQMMNVSVKKNQTTVTFIPASEDVLLTTSIIYDFNS